MTSIKEKQQLIKNRKIKVCFCVNSVGVNLELKVNRWSEDGTRKRRQDAVATYRVLGEETSGERSDGERGRYCVWSLATTQTSLVHLTEDVPAPLIDCNKFSL